MSEQRFPVVPIVVISLVQAAVLCIMIWQVWWRYQAGQQELLARTLDVQTRLLATALAPMVANGDHNALLDGLVSLHGDPGWRYAAVYDHELRRLASLGEAPLPPQRLPEHTQYQQRNDDDLLVIERPMLRASEVVGMVVLGYDSGAVEYIERELLLSNGVLAALALAASMAVLLLAAILLRRDVRHIRAAVADWLQGEWRERIELSSNSVLQPAADALNDFAFGMEEAVSAQREQYDKALQTTRRLQTLLRGLDAVFWEAGPQSGRFGAVEPAGAGPLLDYTVEEWLAGDFCERCIHPDDRNWVLETLRHPGVSAEHTDMDFRLYDKDGKLHWLRLIGTVENRDSGALPIGLILDVSVERRNEQQLVYLDRHDRLTGLLNRSHFVQRLEDAAGESARQHTSGAVLVLDLDRFRRVNVTFGSTVGDTYLRRCVELLHQRGEAVYSFARLGDDEFGFILTETDAVQAADFGEQLLRFLRTHSFLHDNRHASFSAGVGVALFPEHGLNAGELLSKASIALHSAKEEGSNRCRLYEIGVAASAAQERLHREERMIAALHQQRFKLLFQPVVELDSGLIRHYECLLRLIDEDGSLLEPDVFLPVAERAGQLREIDRWTIAHALQAQGISTGLGRAVTLTLNLSGRHFGDPEIIAAIEQATEDARAQPNRIIFEVKEAATVEDIDKARRFIQVLHEQGYRFALDDFDIGVSSLRYLKYITLDYLKIDQQLVQGLRFDAVDRAFVRAVVELAQGLKIEAIAEAVEDRETLAILQELGVPLGQGYYFARPAARFHEVERVVIRAD